MTAHLENMKAHLRLWRQARSEICEATGKHDNDIAKLDEWIKKDFAGDSMPAFDTDAIKQKARELIRIRSAESVVSDLGAREPIAALIDALDWHNGGRYSQTAANSIFWLFIVDLIASLQTELPADLRIRLNTWRRASTEQRADMHAVLQSHLSEHRMEIKPKTTPGGKAPPPDASKGKTKAKTISPKKSGRPRHSDEALEGFHELRKQYESAKSVPGFNRQEFLKHHDKTEKQLEQALDATKPVAVKRRADRG